MLNNLICINENWYIMSRIEEFAKHCIEVRGYKVSEIASVEDQDAASFKPTHDVKIVIVHTQRIDYAALDGVIQALFEQFKVPCVVYTDGANFHIFVLEEGSPTEVDYVPSLKTDDSVAEIKEAKKLKTILRDLRWHDFALGQFPGRDAYGSPSTDALVLAVQAKKNNIELIPQNLTPEVLNGLAFEVKTAYPGAISEGYAKDYDATVKTILRFASVSFTGRMNCCAEVYLGVYHEREGRLNKKVTNSLLKSSEGNTLVLGLATDNYVIESNRQKKDVDIASFRHIDPVVCYLCNNQTVHEIDFVEKKYDTIFLTHIPGAGIMSDINRVLRIDNPDPRSGEANIIKAVSTFLKDGGRLVLITTGAFLFQHNSSVLRKWLLDNYSLDLVLGMKSPLEGTMIPGYIIVLRDGENHGAYFSKADMEEENFGMIADILKNPSQFADLFEVVPQSDVDDIWSPGRYIKNEFTENQDSVPLKDLCEIIRGVSVPSKDYLDDGSFGGVSYLTLKNISEGKLDLQEVKKVPAKYAKRLTQKGDILFSITGTIGKIALVDGEQCIPGGSMVILRSKEGVSPELLFEALSSKEFIKYASLLSHGATIPHLGTNELANLSICYKEAVQ